MRSVTIVERSELAWQANKEENMRCKLSKLSCAVALLVPAATAWAKPPVLSPIDFSACANNTQATGAPVGPSLGNAETKFSKLGFTLLDPSLGSDSWLGAPSASLHIKLSVSAPAAVYMLLNTGWGQNAIPNASVEFEGTGGVHKVFKLVGNTTIRDYNNWMWTNTINNKTTQEWWTNNLNPQPDDNSHREDAHEFNTAQLLAGHTLTDIIVKAPANAGPNVMEPLLFAIAVDANQGAGTLPSTCSTN